MCFVVYPRCCCRVLFGVDLSSLVVVRCSYLGCSLFVVCRLLCLVRCFGVRRLSLYVECYVLLVAVCCEFCVSCCLMFVVRRCFFAGCMRFAMRCSLFVAVYFVSAL